MKKYEVWSEGYQMTGASAQAQFLGIYEAQSFKSACKKAVKDNEWDLDSYNPKDNTYWGCHFFDNEMDARRSFG